MLDLTRPAMQRTSGTGRLAADRTDRGVSIREMFQEGAAKIRFPRRTDPASMEAVLINTAGGLTGGDRRHWAVEAGEGANVTGTTQACEKIYRSAGGESKVSVSLRARAGARIAWMPQETILFDGSRLVRNTDVDLAADASLLMIEAAIFGRQARGETVRSILFRDRWRIRCGGTLVHGEDQRLEGDALDALAHAATGAGSSAFATVLLVGGAATDGVDAMRRMLDGHRDVASGVSAWTVPGTGKLLARLVARDSYVLRKALVPLLGLLNREAPVPRIWSM